MIYQDRRCRYILPMTANGPIYPELLRLRVIVLVSNSCNLYPSIYQVFWNLEALSLGNRSLDSSAVDMRNIFHTNLYIARPRHLEAMAIVGMQPW